MTKNIKKFTQNNCIKCNYPIYDSVYEMSMLKIGFELCVKCQDWFYENSTKTTKQNKLFFLALKKRNLPVEIEKNDGYKTIDITIPTFKLNIEIDGIHHNTNLSQAQSDLKRTYYSMESEFNTIRLPNILIDQKMDETADTITEIIVRLRDKKNKEQEQINELKTYNDFESKVIDFIIKFYTVFELDWVYTIEYLKSEGNVSENLLTDFPFDANWHNKDNMINSYYELLNFMKEKKIFNKILNSDEETLIYQYEFKKRYEL